MRAEINDLVGLIGLGRWRVWDPGIPGFYMNKRRAARDSEHLRRIFSGILPPGLCDWVAPDHMIHFNPGSDPGTIGGPHTSVVTTNGNGDAIIRLTLSGNPADFVRAQSLP